ncbi:MAG: AAA family ATPase, partial [Alphaproteobacteria bacterium]
MVAAPSINRLDSADFSTFPASHGRCRIDRLILTDFRSYHDLEMRTAALPVVLYGENGAGKTNILEALSCLAPGRGLRGAAHADLARHKGAGGWAVVAEMTTADGTHKVASGQPANAAAGERRQMRLNGERQGGA